MSQGNISWTDKNWSAQVELEHPGMAFFAREVVTFFKSQGGVNFVVMDFGEIDGLRLQMELKRIGAEKTPSQRIGELQSALNNVMAEIQSGEVKKSTIASAQDVLDNKTTV